MSSLSNGGKAKGKEVSARKKEADLCSKKGGITPEDVLSLESATEGRRGGTC